MNKNQELALKNPLIDIRELMAGILSFGIILASTHGALFPEHHQDLSATDFTAKVVRELHTHNDFQIQNNHILADPKHLRNIRSEGDKVRIDGLRGNWDVYHV
jgi:hypothetical protein